MKGRLMKTDWVKCPICGECDMRQETDDEGNKLIHCTNHACKSNGGEYQKSDGDKIKYEQCVMCGNLTTVPKNLHVDHRNFYVDGAGQLCDECFSKMYK